MPAGRILLKSISDSKKLSLLKTDGARLLYTWLIAHLDVNGCYSGDPQVINGKVFTRLSKSNKTIEEYLKDMELNQLIIRYQDNGDIFLNVPDFVEKQPSLNPNKEGKTTIPVPTPELLQSYSRVTPPKVKESKVKESKEKHIYAEFVSMLPEEYQKLVNKYGEVNTQKFISKLSIWKEAKGKTKEPGSDYAKILHWVVDAVIGADKKAQLEKDYNQAIKYEKQREKEKEQERKPPPPEVLNKINQILKPINYERGQNV